MEVSGRLNASAGLTLRKTQVPDEYEAGWTPQTVWTLLINHRLDYTDYYLPKYDTIWDGTNLPIS